MVKSDYITLYERQGLVMLNGREIDILELFQEKREIELKFLIDKFKISERMLRYDIEKINFILKMFGINPIFKSKKGTFCLENNEKIVGIKNMLAEVEALTPKNREDIMKFMISLNPNKYNITFLTKFFNISRGTITNDLKNIKENLKFKKLTLNFDRGLKVEGEISETLKYTVNQMIKNLGHLSNNNSYSLKIFQIIDENIKINDIDIFNGILIEILNESELSLSDKNYKILLAYLYLLQVNNFKEKIEKIIILDENIIEGKKEYKIVDKIIKKYGINIFDKDEKIIITDLILKMSSYDENASYYNNWIDLDILVVNLIEDINKGLEIDITKDKLLFEYLKQHLKPLLYRLKNNYILNERLIEELNFNKNNLFYTIKSSLKIISSILQREIPDEEIYLLMLHFQVAIEREKLNNPKVKKIIVVNTLGNGISQAVVNSINSMFNVEILEIVPYFRIKEILKLYKNIDFIITTTDLKIDVKTPILKINPVFTYEDRKKLEENGFSLNNKKILMSELLNVIGNESKRKEEIIKKLMEKFGDKLINDYDKEQKGVILKEENIFFGLKISKIEEGINFCCKVLEKEGSIDRSYGENIIEILKKYPTYLISHNGIIFPHTKNENNVFSTSSVLVELDKEIYFNENNIKYIFTFAIKDKEKDLNKVTKIINGMFSERIKGILNMRDKKEIIKYFNN